MGVSNGRFYIAYEVGMPDVKQFNDLIEPSIKFIYVLKFYVLLPS